jgi:hypothetical protein
MHEREVPRQRSARRQLPRRPARPPMAMPRRAFRRAACTLRRVVGPTTATYMAPTRMTPVTMQGRRVSLSGLSERTRAPTLETPTTMTMTPSSGR